MFCSEERLFSSLCGINLRRGIKPIDLLEPNTDFDHIELWDKTYSRTKALSWFYGILANDHILWTITTSSGFKHGRECRFWVTRSSKSHALPYILKDVGMKQERNRPVVPLNISCYAEYYHYFCREMSYYSDLRGKISSYRTNQDVHTKQNVPDDTRRYLDNFNNDIEHNVDRQYLWISGFDPHFPENLVFMPARYNQSLPKWVDVDSGIAKSIKVIKDGCYTKKEYCDRIYKIMGVLSSQSNVEIDVKKKQIMDKRIKDIQKVINKL